MIPRLISWLLPAACPGCGRDIPGREPVCEVCRASLQPAKFPAVPPGVGRYQALSSFESPLRELILSLKYRGKGYLAAPLAGWMADAAAPWVKTASLIVPVPAPAARRILRGYHPAEILAGELGRRLAVPIAGRALRRRHGFPSQTSLDRRQRGENAEKSFATGWSARKTYGHRVLIVDDVCTTGATLSACAALLRREGAVSVDAMVLAQEAIDPPRKATKEFRSAHVLDEALG